MNCKFKPLSNRIKISNIVKVLYRPSFFLNASNNTLIRKRQPYQECKFDREDGSFVLQIPKDTVTKSGNYILSIYFFSRDEDTKSGQWCQHLSMWCEVSASDVCTVDVYEQGSTKSQDKVKVGTLEMDACFLFNNQAYIKKINHQIQLAQNQIESTILSNYQSIEADTHNEGMVIDNSSFFHYVNDTKARLPVMFFPIMSLFTAWEDTGDAVKLYSNLLSIAKHNCGIETTVPLSHLLDNNDHDTIACIIQEFFTMLYRCLQYNDDTSLDGKVIDRWSVLNILRDRSRESFDCEDGSRAMLDLYCAFIKLGRGLTQNNTDLYDLYHYLTLYTPFMCIGDLHVNDTTDVHVYCILMDTRYIKYIDRSSKEYKSSVNNLTRYLPSIHLESTHHSVGTWGTKDKFGSHEDELYTQVNLTLSKVSYDLGVSRQLVKLRAPINSRMDQHKNKKPLYMNIRVLMSPMYEGCVVQLLVTQHKKFELVSRGDVVDFMNYSKSIDLIVLEKRTITYIEDNYSELFSILPCGHVPKSSDKINILNEVIPRHKIMANFEIQETYYNENIEKFEKLIQSIQKSVLPRSKLVKKLVHLTEDISIVQYWLFDASDDSDELKVVDFSKVKMGSNEKNSFGHQQPNALYESSDPSKMVQMVKKMNLQAATHLQSEERLKRLDELMEQLRSHEEGRS